MHNPVSVLLLQALDLHFESMISLGEMSDHLSTKFYDSNLDS